MGLFKNKGDLFFFLFAFTIVFAIPVLMIIFVFIVSGAGFIDMLQAIGIWVAMASVWSFLMYIMSLLGRVVPQTPYNISKYQKYIEENKTSLGLFARPVYYNKSKIVLANKYVVI